MLIVVSARDERMTHTRTALPTEQLQKLSPNRANVSTLPKGYIVEPISKFNRDYVTI